MKLKEGYVQIYTGNGKGKTTAAIGLAIRAVGEGMKVKMIQFLKTGKTGELNIAKSLAPNFEILRFEKLKGFFWNLTEEEKEGLKWEINQAIHEATKILQNRECDILILDEIMGALNNNLVSEDEIIRLISLKPKDMELVLTGRDVPSKISDLADLVTEMKPLKHYFEKGVNAREGIEY